MRLDAGVPAPAQTIVLRSSAGQVSGTVSANGPAAGPLGGVTVTVAGPDFSRSTTSLTTDPIGTWQVTGVPLPGTYTVTFSAPGYGTQAIGVDLSIPVKTDVNATLTPAASSVTGRVVEASTGAGIVGATVTLTGQGQTRTARTADAPAGTYGFANLPPGAYTITFQRTGSPDLTLAITLVPGPNPQPDAALELPSGITGQVRVNGLPFAGAELRIYLLSPSGPAYPFNPPTATALTDANGQLRVARHPGRSVHHRRLHQRTDPAAVAAGVRQPRSTDRARRLRHQHRDARRGRGGGDDRRAHHRADSTVDTAPNSAPNLGSPVP